MSVNATPSSSCGTSSSGLTAQGTLGAVNDAVTMPTLNCGVVGFQLTGTFVATLTFEASLDGVTWVAINGNPQPTGAAATTATAAGIVLVPCSGFSQVRARVSAWTSGSIVCTGCTSIAPHAT